MRRRRIVDQDAKDMIVGATVLEFWARSDGTREQNVEFLRNVLKFMNEPWDEQQIAAILKWYREPEITLDDVWKEDPT